MVLNASPTDTSTTCGIVITIRVHITIVATTVIIKTARTTTAFLKSNEDARNCDSALKAKPPFHDMALHRA